MNAAVLPRDLAAAPPAMPREDAALFRDAARLTRDLGPAKPWIYWADFGGSALLGYAALALAVTAATPGPGLVAGVVAILALYRAGSFIHEITHLNATAVPGFRAGFNLLVGVPLLVPSFMYEGVHNLHHMRTRYGTADDPEYLPLALMRPATLLIFLGVAVLAPVVLLLRFGVLGPLSALSPALRRVVVERYSALSINPAFRRKAPDGDAARSWILWETLASVWAVGLIAMVVTGVIPPRGFAIFLAVASGVAVINQIRTLVAHLWENDGEAISVTAQYLDTVNVPPPGLLPALWAPVGLRYHALHHLLPGLPYHALGKAHRRLSAGTGAGSPYHRANHRGLPGLVARLVASSVRGRAV